MRIALIFGIGGNGFGQKRHFAYRQSIKTPFCVIWLDWR
jgi:hypothetical protein